jgi:membrane protease YdiL (CAAX protease family)
MKRDWQQISLILLVCGVPALFCVSPAMFFSDPVLKMLMAILALPVFLLCAVLIPCLAANRKSFLQVLDLRPVCRGDTAAALLMIPLFFLFTLSTFAAKSAGVPVEPQKIVDFAKDCPVWTFYIVLFSAGILAPAAEELAFRKVLYGSLEECFPQKKYIPALITAFLFAVSHGIIWQSLTLFIFGLILQWQCIKGSLTRSILMHAAFNWCSLTVLIIARSGIFSETLAGNGV